MIKEAAPLSGPNPDLVSVLVNAQKFALRLKSEQVQDVHLLWALLGSGVVSSEDNAFASAGVRQNTVFLAIKSTFGEGSKKDDKAATFTPEARHLRDSIIDVAANDGRQASPADMLKNIMQNPSLATKMVLSVIVEDHLQRNGAQNIAIARTQVWTHELGMPKIALLKPKRTIDLPQSVDSFLREVSVRGI